MNKLEVYLTPLTESESSRHFEIDLISDLEIAWYIEIDGGTEPIFQITFRGASPENNIVYGFINQLIMNENLKSIYNIEKIILTLKDKTYTILNDKIKQLVTTSSILSTEVTFKLRELVEISQGE